MAKVREIAPEAWPALSARFADLTYEQSAAWSVPAARRLGAETLFLSVEGPEGPLAAAAARVKRVPGLGRGIAWIASGPLTATEGADEAAAVAALSALREEVALRRGHLLRLRPPVLSGRPAEAWDRIAAAAGFRPSDRARGARTVLIELARDDDAMMKALDGKWRTELRAALRAGLEVDRGRGDEAGRAARFRALYDRVREAKGFDSDLSPEFFMDLDGPDFAHEVLIAVKDGEDVAGVLVGETGPVAVYLHGATDGPGRKLRAGYLLTWEAMRGARARGRRWYDLGGIDPDANPGVARFKLRMGGEDLTAPGPYEARPPGPLPALIEGLETLRARLRGRR